MKCCQCRIFPPSLNLAVPSDPRPVGAIWLAVPQSKSSFGGLTQQPQSDGGGCEGQNQAARPDPGQGALKPLTLAHRQGVWANQPEPQRERVREEPLSASPSTIVVCSVGVGGVNSLYG